MIFVSLAFAAPYDVLKTRDEVGCPFERSDRDELIRLAEDVTMQPSWVAVRAAGCALDWGDDPVVAAKAVAWMTDAERPGLALVVAGRIESLPAGVAEACRAAVPTIADERWRKRVEKRLAVDAGTGRE